MAGTANQGFLFLMFALAGVLSGAVYGTLYLARFCFKMHIAANIVCDILFALVAGALFLGAAHYFSGGEIRIYMAAAAVIGFILFYFTFFKLLARMNNLVYNGFIKAVGRLKKVKLFGRLLK